MRTAPSRAAAENAARKVSTDQKWESWMPSAQNAARPAANSAARRRGRGARGGSRGRAGGRAAPSAGFVHGRDADALAGEEPRDLLAALLDPRQQPLDSLLRRHPRLPAELPLGAGDVAVEDGLVP